jgi:hypothetical protein
VLASLKNLFNLRKSLSGLHIEDRFYLIDRFLKEGLFLNHLLLSDLSLEVEELVVKQVVIFCEKRVYLCQLAQFHVFAAWPNTRRRKLWCE